MVKKILKEGENNNNNNNTSHNCILELQKPDIEVEAHNDNKNVTEEKKAQNLRFHSTNKINNYNGGGWCGNQKNLQNMSKHKNNKCFP